MRIDLPLCNLKTCRYSFYGNCTNKNKYDVCEYAFLKRSMERIVERLEELREVNYQAWKGTEWVPDKTAYINASNAYKKAIKIVKEEGAV